MVGRLSTPVSFKPFKLNGMWKREQREYFLLSIAQPGFPPEDRERALALLRKIKCRTLPGLWSKVDLDD